VPTYLLTTMLCILGAMPAVQTSWWRLSSFESLFCKFLKILSHSVDRRLSHFQIPLAFLRLLSPLGNEINEITDHFQLSMQ